MSDASWWLEDLNAWLRIPSISALPEHAGDVKRCAEFTADLLRRAGMENVRLMEKPGRHPLVYGDWLHAPGKPTILCYGHYDVQPVEPLEEWKSPPFDPTVRGENLYCRGAADDKGLLLILIKAAESLKGRLPVNLKFLIEGEEESGGEHITEYVAAKPPELAADCAAVCDTEMFAPELPTINVGLRGIVYGEIHVETARTDLHSGVYGGGVPNAMQAAAELIAALKGRDGRIQIPGLYDAVRPPSPEERAAWARLPFDEAAYREHEAGVNALTGESGVPLFERLWARPTFEVHGIRGGFIGEGAKTVIPARAVVKCSLRLVPDQDPDTVDRQLTAAIAAAVPCGASARWVKLHGAKPSVVDPKNRFVAAAAQAMTEVFGAETVYTRSGGSIPIVGLFEEALGIPSVLMGFGLPDDNLHAPNEKVFLPNIARGIIATARFFEKVSAA
ncbi:MAG: dipeptidase [Bryobacter sp.]|nr:dipeptidase [Bryobacter sp.]